MRGFARFVQTFANVRRSPSLEALFKALSRPEPPAVPLVYNDEYAAHARLPGALRLAHTLGTFSA
jgi:hypothetical protein